MSVIVPELDLAPSVTSRVVTIDVIDMQEGAPATGSVDFILAADLHVPADDKIIQAGSVTVTLDAGGHGEVRLPTYDPDVRPDGWGILVKKSWAPHPYLIRVPEGTTKINLADIEPVQEADPSLVSWLLTGAAVSVVEGSQWGASVTTAGGVARFVFTVPPGAEAWAKGVLPAGTDLNGLTASGTYRIATTAGMANLPVSNIGSLEVIPQTSDSTQPMQRYTTWEDRPRVYVRRRSLASGWGPWLISSWDWGLLPSAGTDLNNVTLPGTYGVQSSAASNLPVTAVGTLEVLLASAFRIQRFTTWEAAPRTFLRRMSSTGWSAWVERGTGVDPEVGTRVSTLESKVSALESGEPAPRPILPFDAQISSRAEGEILCALSADRTVGWNGFTSTLRRTVDDGQSWSDVHTFTGRSMESVTPLANGELLISTTGAGNMREVWLSHGLRSGSPTWDVVLAPGRQYVKFAPGWSISTHQNVVLLNEYGPKSGQPWGESPSIAPGMNARYTYLSLDSGKTWNQIFDLNEFLTAQMERPDADRQHLHGVAWDPYWDRIWVTFGDNFGGSGSNGIVFSDDLGTTWNVAHFYSSSTPSWQVVGVVPMRHAVLFLGDITPSGLMRIDRSAGRSASVYEVHTAYQTGTTGTHLGQAHHKVSLPDGTEVAYFGFGAEGSSARSFIVATRDGYSFEQVWTDDQAQPAGFGLRSIAGPTLRGQMVCAHNDQRAAGAWTELRGSFGGY